MEIRKLNWPILLFFLADFISFLVFLWYVIHIMYVFLSGVFTSSEGINFCGFMVVKINIGFL